MDFSLAFFTSTGKELAGSRYAFLSECARFADHNGFLAIWTPERHFHEFGGIFPNPALMAAHLAAVTSRVRIRAGSFVLPLHNPVRAAEDWSVADNLSGGRVDVSMAVGWHPDDFAIAPHQYEDRIERTYEGIETIRRLWRGDEFLLPNGVGKEIQIKLHPPPVQATLPMWMTCTRATEAFEESGKRGFNVLTALIFLTSKQLGERIAAYRRARTDARSATSDGKLTLMLHTFVGEDQESTLAEVRSPLRDYLRSSVDLWRHENKSLERLTSRKDALEFAFQRYFRTSGLFGSLDACAERVKELESLGVNEIACLIDFGVKPEVVFEGLQRLAELRRRFA